MNRHHLHFLITLLLGITLPTIVGTPAAPAAEPAGASRKIDGFRGIWFDLGQRSRYGSKYSGGLGTYTAKHRPLATYAPQAEKTFFVFGGTTAADQRHLLAMISYYDHRTGEVAKPTVVHDKQTVNDPHDNPSISIDGEGHVWVFVSGRGRSRPGFKYRSRRPFDIEGFEQVSEEEFTYPQPWWIADRGFLHLFTKYTRGRELYWNRSDRDADRWTEDQKLAGMGGHYQISSQQDGRVITAFNMHPGGDVDQRTNLYFVQTDDGGDTWTTVDGRPLQTPLTDPQCEALVHDYAADDRLVYLKDIAFDSQGRPVVLFITSSHYQPGPAGDPRTWTIAHWTGGRWALHDVTQSTHNYDMGSLYIEAPDRWLVIGPTEPGPQHHATGGELAVWRSEDEGRSWRREQVLTSGSPRNHGYVRRPVPAHPDFYAFWADGNPEQLSLSQLYFLKRADWQIFQLPYAMDSDTARPQPLP